MSSAFDEGGAKGLLLVNLGIGESCNIVFDSTEADVADEHLVAEVSGDGINIQSLRQKLEAQLEDEELFDLHLVPQLSSLRAEHDSLVDAGYCEPAVMNTVGPKTPGRRRYKSSSADEALADRSIHEQVRGRIRLSMVDDQESSMPPGTPHDDASISQHSTSAVNFVSDYDFGGDDADGDTLFDNFIANPRFSEEPEPRNETMHLLDAISSGRTQLSTDDFNYFPDKNQWAGSDHWKKKQNVTKKKSTKPKKKADNAKKAKSVPVPLDKAPDVSKYLKLSKTSTTWTKTTVNKNTNVDHVLPIDSNINVEHLTKLFLRPDYVHNVENKESKDEGDKRVSFGLPMMYDNGSFDGGDDDGPGFDLPEPDADTSEESCFVDDLEGIRKVQRIKVGYASVAKKVDVKRLKSELWSELETRFGQKKGTGEDTVDEQGDAVVDLYELQEPLSFQAVLKTMETHQSQSDVTFPFYFICALHLANEKGLVLKNEGLDDFTIEVDQTVIID
jgi:condensin complex subunit 2